MSLRVSGKALLWPVGDWSSPFRTRRHQAGRDATLTAATLVDSVVCAAIDLQPWEATSVPATYDAPLLRIAAEFARRFRASIVGPPSGRCVEVTKLDRGTNYLPASSCSYQSLHGRADA